MRKKYLLGIVVVLLCGTIFLTACQPTPEKAAVVNRSEGIPSDALKEQGGEISGEMYYEAIPYRADGKYTGHIVKNEYFSIDADVDIMVPEAERYPVQKLEKKIISQEQADKLIEYFAGSGKQFFAWPMPMIKADYEQQLIELKKSLAQVEAGGDGEDPASTREYIKEVEAKLAAAPEKNEEKPIDTKFSYHRDYETGVPREEEGEHFIEIAFEKEDGNVAQFYVNDGQGRSIDSYFSYNDAGYELESWMQMQEENEENQREWLQYMEEPYKSEQQGYLDEIVASNKAFRDQFAQNTMDFAAVEKQAIDLLKELGITGVQVSSVEKALLSPMSKDSGGWSERNEGIPSEAGCAITFTRECGGVPCEMQMSGSTPSKREQAEGMYSAPFYLEQATIVIDAQGKVRAFDWTAGAQVVEAVAGDSELLPFEEIQKRAIDQFYWMGTMNYDDDYKIEDSDTVMRIEIKEVKLCMAYINAKDEPDKVLVVPAWHFKAQEYGTYIGEEDVPTKGKEQKWNQNEVMISALDGSPILMPGMEQQFEEMEKWEQENSEIIAVE